MQIDTFQKMPYEDADTSGLIKETTSKFFKNALIAGTVISSSIFSSPAVSSHIIPETYRYGHIETESFGISSYENSALETLRSYSYDHSEAANIFSYIVTIPESQAFLAGLAPIIEKIYPGLGKNKQLKLVQDPDTGQPLLKLTFNSGLSINEEFLEKDRMINEAIIKADLAFGFQYVVFSNC